jgi:hypothetical protein
MRLNWGLCFLLKAAIVFGGSSKSSAGVIIAPPDAPYEILQEKILVVPQIISKRPK